MNKDKKINITRPIILGSLVFGIMSFILPIYAKNMGADAVKIGGLFSAFSIVALIMRPLVGIAIDKLGRKAFFVAAFFFYSVSMIIFSFSTNIFGLYIGRLVQAVGSSLMWISAYSIAMDISSENSRGKSIGRVDAASAKGSLYGAIIGFIFLSSMNFKSGWSYLLRIYAVISAAAGIIVIRDIPETHKNSVNKDSKKVRKFPREIYKLMIVVFVTSVSVSMLSPIMMIYLQDKFTSNINTLAKAFLPSAIIYSYLPAKLGGISDKRGRIIPIALGMAISAVISILIPTAKGISLLVVFWCIEAVGNVMASPAEEALIADIVGEKDRGAGYGMYLFILSLGATVGPLLGGWLYDNYSHAMVFCINGGILFLNAAFALVLFRNRIFMKKIKTYNNCKEI